MDKPTDKQLLAGVRYCNGDERRCDGCPLRAQDDCCGQILNYVNRLVNRLVAENEQLTKVRDAAIAVVRAEWLNFINDYSTAECSKCGELYEASDHRDKEHFDAFKRFYKFCPNCGAKMDGQEDKP